VKRLGAGLGWLVALGVGAWALTLLFVVAVVALWPEDRPAPAPGDAIICLGAGLSHYDPQLAGPASERRALTCGALYAEGTAPVVIFSGIGSEERAVADAMADRAIAAGLPADVALREPNSRSTIQNAAFSLDMLSDPDRVIVVSDPFHLPRAWLIFKAMGVDEIALYAAAPIEDYVPHRRDKTMWSWTLRESLAIWLNAGRAAAYVVGGLFGVDHDTRIAWFN
jgi:uncharacterized SAM-binding protein YcdF (DUF218 family)